jgi:hypothetical protein
MRCVLILNVRLWPIPADPVIDSREAASEPKQPVGIFTEPPRDYAWYN